MSNGMTVGSLFSGIGGLDLGLERAGFHVKWQVELDDYCTRVLSKHWPHVPKFRDVRDVGRHNLDPVDLICGGFPCQPHSFAGKRQASADDRDLWAEFARLIGELRPRWVLAENVPGLLSSERGRFFGRVLRDLAAFGYDAEWDCIPSVAVGAPHIRDRVFILAYPNSSQRRPLTERRILTDGHQGGWQQGASGPSTRCQDGGTGHVADPALGGRRARGERRFTASGSGQPIKDEPLSPMAHVESAGLAQREVYSGATEKLARFKYGSVDGGGSAEYWHAEPPVGRMANGVPRWVDRLRGLGNAVVPQVAEFIGRLIVDIDKDTSHG